MIIRCCFIYIFFVFLNRVSLDVTVKHFVGDSAVLQCSYTADRNKVHTVNWLFNDENVYQFSPGSPEIKNNRVESFPDEYVKGNYSIKIKKLEQTDEGGYTCLITPAYHHENIHLIIEPKGVPSVEEEKPKTTRQTNIQIIIICCIVISACGLFLFILCRRKICRVKGCY